MLFKTFVIVYVCGKILDIMHWGDTIKSPSDKDAHKIVQHIEKVEPSFQLENTFKCLLVFKIWGRLVSTW